MGSAFQHDLQQSGLMAQGRTHDPTAIELRIDWLEKEVHLLRARIAKLERSDAY